MAYSRAWGIQGGTVFQHHSTVNLIIFTYEASTDESVSIRSFIFSKSALLGGLLVAPSCGSLTSIFDVPDPPGSEGAGGPGLKCDLINCKQEASVNCV